MGAQFPVDRGASHAQEDAQLSFPQISVSDCFWSMQELGTAVRGSRGWLNRNDIHSMMPKLENKSLLVRDALRKGSKGPSTGIPSLTVGAKVVAGYALQKILQDLFVARLLTLTQSRGHVGCSVV